MRALLLLALLLPSTALAAFDGVLLTTSPTYPRPNEQVTITASAIGVGANQFYVWEEDGVRVQSGVNAKEYVAVAPEAGESKTVSVSVVAGGRTVASGTTVLAPAEVRIEWEGTGARPPFYTGRPLFTAHGTMRATTITNFVLPSGTRVPQSQILYTWSVDGVRDDTQSGFGRTTVVVEPPFYDRPFSVSVVASTRDETLSATDVVLGTPRGADLVVYETTPLGGLLDHRAIDRRIFPFTESEVSFIAFPLHTLPENGTYAWTLNGEAVELDTGNPRLAVFKKVAQGAGEFEVGVAYNGLSGFLDEVGTAFLLSF
jgi:hypothetical protein